MGALKGKPLSVLHSCAVCTMTNFLPAKSAPGSNQQCFQLTYQTLEGYANLLGRKIAVRCMHTAIALFAKSVAPGNLAILCVCFLSDLSLSLHPLPPIQNHVTLADYHLHCCMYSTSTKQFIGRFCESMRCGLVESLQTGAVVCPIQEV